MYHKKKKSMQVLQEESMPHVENLVYFDVDELGLQVADLYPVPTQV